MARIFYEDLTKDRVLDGPVRALLYKEKRYYPFLLYKRYYTYISKG
jgi:hypothetical protein